MDYKILNIDGTDYETLLNKKFVNRKKWVPVKTEEIRTVIPGTVVKLNVKKGDKVKEGEVLMLFEAMKMQNIIQAPHSGKITDVKVKEGESLPKGALMMIID